MRSCTTLRGTPCSRSFSFRTAIRIVQTLLAVSAFVTLQAPLLDPRETEVGMFLRLRLRTTGATLSMVNYGGSASRAVKVRIREVHLIPRTRVGRTDQGLNKR